MGVVLQISDPHFGTEQPQVARALLALAEQVQPTVAVWSGDITQRARHRQFEGARQFAEQMGAPHLVVVPGNHDIPLFNLAVRLFDPYRGFRRAFGEVLSPTLSLPDLFVRGVNTTRPWRHKNGEVSRRQIDAVARDLRNALPGQLRIVVVHQPLWITEDHDRGNLLRGHDQALEAWGAAGADVIMGGHIHLPYVRQLTVSSPHGPRRLWIVQAGTALSSRVRGDIPNSVNLIRFSGALAGQPPNQTIERWDFNAGAERFEQVSGVEMSGASWRKPM